MSLGRCPECNKLISLRFPIHDCTPSKKRKQEMEHFGVMYGTSKKLTYVPDMTLEQAERLLALFKKCFPQLVKKEKK